MNSHKIYPNATGLRNHSNIIQSVWVLYCLSLFAILRRGRIGFFMLTSRTVCFIWVMLLFFSSPALAQHEYLIDSGQSDIQGAVRYSVVGRYEAKFEKISGAIYYDPKNTAKSSVDLTIYTNSLKSEYPVLDRAAKSRRLLDVGKYPQMTFKSTRMEPKGKRMMVTGVIEAHGVKQTITFPFDLTGPIYDYGRQKYVKASGQWLINRKDFGITWNKALDKGGVVVGDTITVDWEVIASMDLNR